MERARAGAPDSDASLAVVDAVRAGDVSGAVATVRDLWESGVAAASLWDGLVCAAAERMFVDKTGETNQRGGEVHALTNVNSMRNGFLGGGSSEETKRLLLLQATAFATLFNLSGTPVRFETLTADPAAGATLEAMRATLGSGEVELLPSQAGEHLDGTKQREVANALLAYVADGHDSAQLVAQHLTQIRATAKRTHSVKFPAALLEELGRVAPEHQARLLPALAFYMSGEGAGDWPGYAETASIVAEVAPTP